MSQEMWVAFRIELSYSQQENEDLGAPTAETAIYPNKEDTYSPSVSRKECGLLTP